MGWNGVPGFVPAFIGFAFLVYFNSASAKKMKPGDPPITLSNFYKTRDPFCASYAPIFIEFPNNGNMNRERVIKFFHLHDVESPDEVYIDGLARRCCPEKCEDGPYRNDADICRLSYRDWEGKNVTEEPVGTTTRTRRTITGSGAGGSYFKGLQRCSLLLAVLITLNLN